MKTLELSDVIDLSEQDLKSCYQETLIDLEGNSSSITEKQQMEDNLRIIISELKARGIHQGNLEWDHLQHQHQAHPRKEGIPGLRHRIGNSSRGAF